MVSFLDVIANGFIPCQPPATPHDCPFQFGARIATLPSRHHTRLASWDFARGFLLISAPPLPPIHPVRLFWFLPHGQTVVADQISYHTVEGTVLPDGVTRHVSTQGFISSGFQIMPRLSTPNPQPNPNPDPLPQVIVAFRRRSRELRRPSLDS